MAELIHDLGPFENLRFDLRVADFIRSSITPSDLAALRSFFEELQRSKMSVTGEKLGNVWLVAVANHIIEFYFKQPGSAPVIMGIHPSYVS
jgi:hypothetical protein